MFRRGFLPANPGGFDVVGDWVRRVVANGGTVSVSTQAAVQTFYLGMRSDGVWGSILRLNLFAGDQLAACLVPLVYQIGTATETNTNFVSGDYALNQGLKGNGTTKRLNTGVTNKTCGPVTYRHIGAYVRVVPGGNCPIMGNTTAATSLTSIHTSATVYRTPVSINGTDPSALANTAVGWFTATRQSTFFQSAWQNGVLFSPGPLNYQEPTTTEPVFVFGGQSGSGFGNCTLAGYSMGYYLTPDQQVAFYARMQAFQTALGRQV